MDWTEHLSLIVGAGGIRRLGVARIIVFGVGGIGSYAVEALTRAGIGSIDIVDNDTVSSESIDRQLTASYSVVGRPKADVGKERINMINPDCSVNAYEIFATPDNIREFPIRDCDYVVDALDSIPVKVALAKYCEEMGVPVISCMGAKNRLKPLLFTIGDIYDTSVCPMAETMRIELKKAGVRGLKVVYSTEEPMLPKGDGDGCVSFISGVIGMLMAGEIVNDLLLGVAGNN